MTADYASGTMRAVDLVPPGLADELFVRGEAPMTKAEVRAVTMAGARLRPGERALDIGAGTGSLTVEAALLCAPGEVVAVERSAAARELLRANLERFRLDGVTVVAGAAPAALAGLGDFDAIFVGGSGGDLAAILAALPGLLRPGGRVVFNTVCLETTATVTATLRRPPWAAFACSQVAVARAVAAGPLLRFEALNPVWVSSARLAETTGDRLPAGDPGASVGEPGTRTAQASAAAPAGSTPSNLGGAP